MKNFAVTGVGGYIAPRHLQAIKDTGNQLIAAVDPKDSVGILDRFGFDVRFFTEFERFDRHLEKLRRGPEEKKVHYISVCAPNYLHDAHCRLALRIGSHAICEKPLVVNPWNLDALQELEYESGTRIYNVLQLRVHPKLIALRKSLLEQREKLQREVILTYITARGNWYHVSWKGDEAKSGGVATNIGVHLFDLMIWLFGEAGEVRVYHKDQKRISGFIELEHARVRWYLSVDPADIALVDNTSNRTTYRSITIDGEEIDFTEGFTDLHTRVYEEILADRGFGIDDARPSINLVYLLRNARLSNEDIMTHPLLTNRQSLDKRPNIPA